MNKRIVVIARHLIFSKFLLILPKSLPTNEKTVMHTLFNDLLQRIDNEKINWIAQDNQIIFAFLRPKLNEKWHVFNSKSRDSEQLNEIY